MAEILLRTGQTRKELQKIFSVSRPTVTRALKYRTDTDLARRIRKMAIHKGGVHTDF